MRWPPSWGAYGATLVAGLTCWGVTDELLAFAVETTCSTAVLFVALLEVVTFRRRRCEYRADQVAAAAVVVAGFVR